MRFELRRRRRVYEKCSFFLYAFLSLSVGSLSFLGDIFSLGNGGLRVPRDRTRRTRAVVLDENGTIEHNSLGTTRARGSLRFFYARFLRRDEIFTTKKRGYERARKPERREEWWLYPKREREMIRFVQMRSLFVRPIAASRAKILTSFSSPWCSDIEQFNKKSPGSPSPPRRRPSTKSVSKPPHLREKNQPGTPSSKSAAPNNSSPRADTTSATPYRAWNQGPRWLLRES